MAVALLRGVKFVQNNRGYWQPFSNVIHDRGAQKALRDVCQWLGFDYAKDYLDTMREIGAKVLDRRHRRTRQGISND